MQEYYEYEMTEPTFTDVLKDIMETGGILAWGVLAVFIAAIIFSIIVIVTIIKDSHKKE